MTWKEGAEQGHALAHDFILFRHPSLSSLWTMRSERVLLGVYLMFGVHVFRACSACMFCMPCMQHVCHAQRACYAPMLTMRCSWACLLACMDRCICLCVRTCTHLHAHAYIHVLACSCMSTLVRTGASCRCMHVHACFAQMHANIC